MSPKFSLSIFTYNKAEKSVYHIYMLIAQGKTKFKETLYQVWFQVQLFILSQPLQLIVTVSET